jgi:hypothetical protein
LYTKYDAAFITWVSEIMKIHDACLHLEEAVQNAEIHIVETVHFVLPYA